LCICSIPIGATIASDHGDPGTVDLLSRFVQIHEKHEWWARDILRMQDGFHPEVT
jgi:starvation-inducible DNA-binding protein